MYDSRQNVPLDAADEEVLLVDERREIAGADVQHADVGAADRPGQLDADVERNLAALEQSDRPAEERVDVGSRLGNASRRLGSGAGEGEDAGPFEKERSLLGKEQREARQVDLTGVHFGLAEVGVERRRQLQARRDVVEDVEAGFLRCARLSPAVRSQRAAMNGRTSRLRP